MAQQPLPSRDAGERAPLRVVYADDSLPMRRGIAAILEDEDEVELVAVREDLAGLLDATQQLTPDVVLTDLRMPPTGTDEGLRAAEQLRVSAPGTAVIVLSQYADAACARALVAEGSGRRGYLLKDKVTHPDVLVGALRAVASGSSCIDPDIVSTLVNRHASSQALARLTGRELEVLAALASGLSNAGIAAQLFVSERAVEKHIRSLFLKLDLVDSPDANRRVQAALLFLANRPA